MEEYQHMVTLPALWRERQENWKLEGSMGYIFRTPPPPHTQRHKTTSKTQTQQITEIVAHQCINVYYHTIYNRVTEPT